LRNRLLSCCSVSAWQFASGAGTRSAYGSESAFRSGDLNQAASVASRILAREPGSSAAHMILGLVAAQRNQWLAAEKSFGAIIRLEPSNPFGYFYLGQVSLNQQKWAQAGPIFLQAREHQYPDGDRLMVELALAENEAGQPRQALDSLNKIQGPGNGSYSAQYYAVKAFRFGKVEPAGTRSRGHAACARHRRL